MKLKTMIMRLIFIPVFLLLSFTLLKSQNVGIGNTDPKAKLDISGDLILKSADLSLADGNTLDLDVNTNKYNHYKLIGPTGNFQIGGINAAEHDRIITLYNRSGHSLEVYNDDVNASEPNRILTGTGGTFAVYPGGSVTLKYDNTINKWEITASHYNSLDNFGSGNWSLSGNDIYNANVGNVGINTTTPLTSLQVNGNLSLVSDTVLTLCSTIIPPSTNNRLLINNIAKKRSVFHIMEDTSCQFTMSPLLLGLTGGTDGHIVTIFMHINNSQVLHMSSISAVPTAADSLNMIELFEPNNNGNINQPTQLSFNIGGAITLIYDGIRNKWKPINYYGEIKSDLSAWFKGPNPNDIYNPNSGNVGIGNGSPNEKLDVIGNIKISGELKPNGISGQTDQVLTSNGNGNMIWSPISGWSVNGNSGTTSNNYIGTNDNQPLRFKVNGNNAGIINPINDNTAIGNYALLSNMAGSNNSAFGSYSMQSNTTGINNTAVGVSALFANITGFKNTAIGMGALASNSSGFSNTALGYSSLQTNTTGFENTSVGISSMENNNTGSYNSGFGAYTLQSNTSGYNNSAVGHYSLSLNTTGYENVAMGNFALSTNSTGYWNTAVGFGALLNNTTAAVNSAFGYHALRNNTTGFNNSAFGYKALYSNNNNVNIVNSGIANSAFGTEALRDNTTGFYNSAFGDQAMLRNTTGKVNSAFGVNALSNNTTGNDNSAFGMFALVSLDSGNNNTAMGSGAMYGPDFGDNNTVIGYGAYAQASVGSFNTGVGANTFHNINLTAINYSTALGNMSGPTSNFTNSISIGHDCHSNGTDRAEIGSTFMQLIGGYTPWTTLVSDGRFKKNVKTNVKGLDFILQLRPVTYTVDYHALEAFKEISSFVNYSTTIDGIVENKTTAELENIHTMQANKEASLKIAEAKIQSGFIAQDVLQAAELVNYDFDGVNKPQHEKDNYSIAYSQFVVPLVKAVQEQQEIIESLLKRIEILENR